MKNVFREKRKYERKIAPRVFQHKVFLIRQLQREWEEGEKMAKREDMIRKAKAGGIALGNGLFAILLVAGVLTVAAVAPNIFSAFGRARGGRRTYRTYVHRDYFRREVAELKKYKYISVEKEHGEYQIRLTALGVHRAIARSFHAIAIPKPSHWDGIWRMVVFDIPDTHKSAREGFREKLKAMGFHSLQKSIFVFPYPCEAELKFLISIYDIDAYVRFIETNHIVDDNDIQKYFAVA